MSTNANIAILNTDGKTAQRVYCHWDGYPSSAGKTLLKNYTTTEQVQELIAGGNMSQLGKTVGTKHDFNGPYDETQTLYYGRDRGEKGQKAIRVSLARGQGWESILEQEYLYLWDGKRWLFSDHGRKMKRLTAKACKN